ncbi:MAG: hypothetical protein PHY93_21030 [Bacteriovorax sp.]|nr:hypothetical protein [Bacteriovorax sp.]
MTPLLWEQLRFKNTATQVTSEDIFRKGATMENVISVNLEAIEAEAELFEGGTSSY